EGTGSRRGPGGNADGDRALPAQRSSEALAVDGRCATGSGGSALRCADGKPAAACTTPRPAVAGRRRRDRGRGSAGGVGTVAVNHEPWSAGALRSRRDGEDEVLLRRLYGRVARRPLDGVPGHR